MLGFGAHKKHTSNMTNAEAAHLSKRKSPKKAKKERKMAVASVFVEQVCFLSMLDYAVVSYFAVSLEIPLAKSP
jgi:hypothetical protein